MKPSAAPRMPLSTSATNIRRQPIHLRVNTGHPFALRADSHKIDRLSASGTIPASTRLVLERPSSRGRTICQRRLRRQGLTLLSERCQKAICEMLPLELCGGLSCVALVPILVRCSNWCPSLRMDPSLRAKRRM